MKEHHFRVEDAVKFGVEKAILLYNIRFWLEKNKANKKHVHKHSNGNKYFWTYNSSVAFEELFPYLAKSSINRWLRELENDGILLINSFNTIRFDKTLWFSMPEYETDTNNLGNPEMKEYWKTKETLLSQNESPISQNGMTIPDINTDRYHPEENISDLTYQESDEDGNPIIKKKEKKTKPLVVYSQSEQMQKLKDSTWLPDKLISLYWEKKGYQFDNYLQQKTRYDRDLKPAKQAVEANYSFEFLVASMFWCEKKYEDNWTLETILNKAQDIRNDLYGSRQ